MPENKIIVDLELHDDLTPKLHQIKTELSSMPKGPAHEGGGFMADQMKELSSGISYQIGAWSLGYLIADQITKAIGTTISLALSKEFEAVKFENLTRGISGVNDLLKQTKQIADATNQSFKDVTEQRFTLEKAGVPYGEQGVPLEIIGKMAAVSGEHADKLAEMVGHIKEGTASEREMLDIAALISPELEQQVQALRDREVLMPQILRQMEQEEHMADRQKVLSDRTYEDRQRNAALQMAFAEKTGVTETAFKQQYRNIDPSAAAQQKAMADAAYESRGKYQAKFKEGEEQIRKEMGYSDTTMSEMLKSGLIGSKDLLEASQRAEEERKRNSDRAFEDQRYGNQMKAEGLVLDKDMTKLSLLQQERDALFDQVQAQATLNQLTEQYNKEQATVLGRTQKIGREVQGAQEDAGLAQSTVSEMSKKLHEIPFTPAAETWGPAAQQPTPEPGTAPPWMQWLSNLFGASQQQPSRAQPASESTLKDIGDKLDRVFQ